MTRCLGKSGQETWDKDVEGSFECKRAIGLIVGGIQVCDPIAKSSGMHICL